MKEKSKCEIVQIRRIFHKCTTINQLKNKSIHSAKPEEIKNNKNMVLKIEKSEMLTGTKEENRQKSSFYSKH